MIIKPDHNKEINKMDKAKILEWIENATETVERARKESKNDYHICDCNGKLNAFGILKEKIEKGQFD
jgi:hypothetical protein